MARRTTTTQPVQVAYHRDTPASVLAALAVAKKFGDDSAGNLAALMAYYGFLSLFPLLLALTTVLATVLGSHPDLQRRILNSALTQFPVIGEQIRSNVHSLHGSGVALGV